MDEVKRVVEAARKKAGAAAAPVRDFNEEDHYMDGTAPHPTLWVRLSAARLLSSLPHCAASASLQLATVEQSRAK